MNKNLPWKTGVSTPRRARFSWPTFGQILGQVLIILVVGGVWSVLLFGFLWLTNTGPTATMAAESISSPANVAPAVTPTQRIAAVSSPPPPRSSAVVAPSTSQPAAEIPTSSPQRPTATPLSQPTAAESPTPAVTSVPPAGTAPAPGANDPAAISFKQDIFPIFEQRCIKCHGGVNQGKQRIEEGLKMTSYEDIMTGSNNGPVIEPGDVKNSYLIELIVKGKMPKKEPRLLPGQIQLITAWVEAGAPNN